MRIVSLLPSATEICFALGAGDEVHGVTFECDYPAAARERRIVSTTTDVPVWAVDANGYSARPGPRLVDGVEALAGILRSTAVDPEVARQIR